MWRKKRSFLMEKKNSVVAHCDFVMYQNCAAAVAVVIKCGDEIFLFQEKPKSKIRKTRFGWRFYRPKRRVPKKLVAEKFGRI